MKSETKKAGWLLGGAAAIASGLYLLFRKKPAAAASSAKAIPAATGPDADTQNPSPVAPPTVTAPVVWDDSTTWQTKDVSAHFLKRTYPACGPLAGQQFWARNKTQADVFANAYLSFFKCGTPNTAALGAITPGVVHHPRFGPHAGKNIKTRTDTPQQLHGALLALANYVYTNGPKAGTAATTTAPAVPAIPSVDSHIVPGAEDPAFTPPAAAPPGAPPPIDPSADGTQSPGAIAALAAQMQQGANTGADVINQIATFGDTEPQS